MLRKPVLRLLLNWNIHKITGQNAKVAATNFIRFELWWGKEENLHIPNNCTRNRRTHAYLNNLTFHDMIVRFLFKIAYAPKRRQSLPRCLLHTWANHCEAKYGCMALYMSEKRLRAWAVGDNFLPLQRCDLEIGEVNSAVFVHIAMLNLATVVTLGIPMFRYVRVFLRARNNILLFPRIACVTYGDFVELFLPCYVREWVHKPSTGFVNIRKTVTYLLCLTLLIRDIARNTDLTYLFSNSHNEQGQHNRYNQTD